MTEEKIETKEEKETRLNEGVKAFNRFNLRVKIFNYIIFFVIVLIIAALLFHFNY